MRPGDLAPLESPDPASQIDADFPLMVETAAAAPAALSKRHLSVGNKLLRNTTTLALMATVAVVGACKPASASTARLPAHRTTAVPMLNAHDLAQATGPFTYGPKGEFYCTETAFTADDVPYTPDEPNMPPAFAITAEHCGLDPAQSGPDEHSSEWLTVNGMNFVVIPNPHPEVGADFQNAKPLPRPYAYILP